MTDRTAGLESVLAGEHAAVYGYGVAGAELVTLQAPLPLLAAARSGLDAHRVSRDRLNDAVAAAGGNPAGALPAYQIPFALNGTAAVLRLLISLEDRLCEVAAAAVAADTGRLVTADVLSAAAVRATRLRLLFGLPAGRAASAFPGLPGLT